MELTEVKKDLRWSQIIGIIAIIGLAILMGGSLAIGLDMYFKVFRVGDDITVTSTGNSVMIPDWVDFPAIIVAIVVLVVIGILALVRLRKRE
ncbi:MAG: hypothetical protein ACFE96_00460 [Candidatus Hermodarchaeota archaeon]